MPDQDLEIRGGGGVRSSRSLKKGGPGLEKKFFRHFGPHFGGKIRGDPGPPLDLPLLSLLSQARVLFLVKPEFCQVPFSTTFRSFIDHHTFVFLSAVQNIKKFIYKIRTLNFFSIIARNMQNSIKTCGNLCTELGPPVDRGQGRKLQVIRHFRHLSFFITWGGAMVGGI